MPPTARPSPPPGPDLVPRASRAARRPTSSVTHSGLAAPNRASARPSRPSHRVRNARHSGRGRHGRARGPAVSGAGAAARVARVLSVSATAGSCTHVRPVRCELGTLAAGPGGRDPRSRARLLVTGPLQTVVFASTSRRRTRNTTNNAGVAAGSQVQRRRPRCAAGSARRRPAASGALELPRERRRPRQRGHARSSACARAIPTTFTQVRGAGDVPYRGARCRDYSEVSGRGASASPCRGVPAAGGRPALPGLANASRPRRSRRARSCGRCRSPPAPAPPRCGACAADLRRALRAASLDSPRDGAPAPGPHAIRPRRERGARLRALVRIRPLPPRARGHGGRELLDRDPAAERHRRAAHGARAQRHDPGHADPLRADARQAHEVDPRHRPRRDRDADAGRAAARLRGHEPRGDRPRGVHRARVALARAVRRHDHRPVQAARRVVRLRRGALHARRGVRPRRC